MAAAALDKAALGIPDGGTWAAELPEELSEVAAQLQNGEVRWCSGLRIGDPVEIGAPHKHLSLLPPSNIIEWSTVSIIVFHHRSFPHTKTYESLYCSGGLGPQWHLLPGEIQQENRTRADAAVATGGTFRFIELFAGIGGTRRRARARA